MQLRPYQQKVIDSVLAGFREFTRQLAVCPTGSGKTVIFSNLAKLLQPKRTLILAHREELIDQAIDKLHKATGVFAGKEKAEFKASLADSVVVASVQTMIRRLDKWPADHFGLVVADEAHHAISDSWQKVLKHFTGAWVLGVTATSDRGDKRNLGCYFENVAAEVQLFDLINQGYLSRISVHAVPLEIKLDGVKQVAGDYDANGLGDALAPYMRSIAQSIRTHADFRRTLVFLPLIATSKTFVDICQAEGINAAHVDGYSSDRAEILKRFAAGEHDVLCNAMLLTEGFDDCGIDCVVILRPTRSRALYCLDCETEILTDHGWRKIDDKFEPSELAASFHLDGTITYEPIQGHTRRFTKTNESFIQFNNPHLDIRVTDNHDMVISTRHGRKHIRSGWKKIKAADALNTNEIKIPVAGFQQAEGVALTNDELRFIGLVITDGNINPKNNQITIYQSERYPNIIEYIEKVIHSCGFKYGHSIETKPTNFGERSPLHRWTISKGIPKGRDKDKRGWNSLSAYLDKDWPDEFESLTREQLLIVLEAMHAGDGKKCRTADYTLRTISICTANNLLADRLQSLCVRRGIRCNLGVAGTGNSMTMINCSPNRQTWSLPKSASDNRPVLQKTPAHNEPVWCISVPSGMIITRRNGKVAVVGNSQMVGRGTRIAPGKRDLLLLDFLWLHETHNLIRPAHLVATSEEIAEQMTEEAFKSGGESQMALDLQGLASETQAKREKKLQEELASKAKRKSKTVDAMEFCLSLHAPAEVTEWEDTMGWHGKGVTPGQVSVLERNGIDMESVRSRGHASALIDLIISRSKLELCTPKQMRMLQRFGVKNPEQKSFKEASAILNNRLKNESRGASSHA